MARIGSNQPSCGCGSSWRGSGRWESRLHEATRRKVRERIAKADDRWNEWRGCRRFSLLRSVSTRSIHFHYIVDVLSRTTASRNPSE